MGIRRSENKYTDRGILNALLLFVAGLAVNFLGSRLVEWLSLPMYLDSIGTILAAALGGFIPGITVGFVTNVIKGVGDYTSSYYSVLNVLIAVLAAEFARRGFFRSVWKTLLSIVCFALIGGVLGTAITWFLYGEGFGTGFSAPLAHAMYDGGLSSVFLSQAGADFIFDLLDKAVSVLAVVGVLALLPQEIKRRFNFHDWQNDTSRKSQPTKGLTLGTKILLLLALAILIIAVVVTEITFNQFHDAALEDQYVVGDSVSNVVASLIDGNKVETYIEQGEAADDYLIVKKHLQAIMDGSPDISFVYVYRIQEDGCHVVFDLDTPELQGESPGAVVAFDESFREYLPALLAGEEIPPVISDDTYGWLLTFYRPVYDDAGVCQCYAAVDLSMPRILAHERSFMAKTIALFLSFFIVVLAFGVFFAKHGIVRPINAMAEASSAFAYNSAEARHVTLERIHNLKIHTRDEIENLYHSFVETTSEMVRYINEIQEKNEKIANLQNGLVMVLADVVESRDKCTGDHIKKTAAYARVIMEQMRKEGVHGEELTDEYIQDVVNSAPLHDVGKIYIPDSVLNKPGKLTDDEFSLMKTHTSQGADIIQKAIEIVSEPDSSYLNEAKTLANYHHERWDGRGYPRGLAGEDIPLSARIMALADVFDALVSRRSYKEPFTFEKAMEIIRDGVGKQFDPNIAACFFHAADQVRAVSESHGEHI